MIERVKDFVFIGDYDIFAGWDIVIDSVSLQNTLDGRKIINDLACLPWEEYEEYFKKKFPDKIVVYNCDGSYYFFINGKRIKL